MTYPKLATFLLATLCAGLATVAVAQEGPPADPVQEGFFGAGVGELRVDGERRDLPYTSTYRGLLVALEPVVRSLGAGLELGPLGHGYHLRIADQEFLFGPDSTMLARGETLVPLPQPPVLTGAELQVPIALLEHSFGTTLGYSFAWLESEHVLLVQRGASRVLPFGVELVPYVGMTTVLLSFLETPRYQVIHGNRALELRFPGARLELEGSLPRGDALVPAVRVQDDRVRIELGSGAETAAPYTVERGRVQLVIDVSQQRQPTAEPQDLGPAVGLLPTRPALGARIVIDPGHGGDDLGARGPSGSLEKDLTLLLARALKRGLEERLPVRVELTREQDVARDLSVRTAFANQNQADLFISLHLNSAPGATSARGAETYILDPTASDELAAASAAFENEARAGAETSNGLTAEGSLAGAAAASDLDLQLILWDLAQNRHLERSLALGTAIQEELNLALQLRDRGVKQAPFRVLTGANMPAVLVELGFLSNPEEEARLNDATYRRSLVNALVDAIVRFRTVGPAATPRESATP